MALFDFLRRGREPARVEPTVSQPAVAESKASAAASVVVQYSVGEPQWSGKDFESFASESYLYNAVGYRCSKLIATAAAAVPKLLAQKDGTLVEDSPLLDLLRRPNPRMSGRFFDEAVITYQLLSGDAYIEGVGPTGKGYRELWTHRPDRMKVVPGKYGLPMAYEYEMGGAKKRWQVNPMTGASDILHLRRFNPLDEWYGLSAVEAGHYGIDRHNEASKHNKALLQNGARPSGALVFEPIPGTGGMGASHAPNEVLQKAERDLAERHQGSKNAGKPMVLNGNVRWEAFGLSPKDMDFEEGKLDAARDICLAWGVPPMLIVRGESTYNNMAEAKFQLYEETVLPLLEEMIEAKNGWLVPAFGDGLKLLPDYDAIPALEQRRESKRTSVLKLLESGTIDANEARAELDYGDRDPDAVQNFDATDLTALIATVEVTGPEPLFRFMRYHGLIAPGTTIEEMMTSAMSLIEDDEEDLDDEQDQEGADPEADDDDET